MSNQKAHKIPQTSSKIDSGLTKSRKRSSEVQPMKTRQPSQVSRSSSHQSNPNLTGRKRFSTSATRPSTSSLPPVVGIVDDKLQRGVHKLGKLPNYLRQSRRPATVGSGQSESKEIEQALVKNSPKSKDVLDGIYRELKKNVEHKVARASEVRREDTVILRTEGCGDTQNHETEILLAKEMQLVETRERMQELEQQARRQHEELQKKIQELEAEIEMKALVIKKQEEEIKELKKQLAKAEIALEESQDEIFELTEKTADADWLKDCLEHAEKTRRSSEEQMIKLEREIALLKEQTFTGNEDISKDKFDQETCLAEFEEEKRLFHVKWQGYISSLRANCAKIASSEDEDDSLVSIQS